MNRIPHFATVQLKGTIFLSIGPVIVKGAHLFKVMHQNMLAVATFVMIMLPTKTCSLATFCCVIVITMKTPLSITGVLKHMDVINRWFQITHENTSILLMHTIFILYFKLCNIATLLQYSSIVSFGSSPIFRLLLLATAAQCCRCLFFIESNLGWRQIYGS